MATALAISETVSTLAQVEEKFGLVSGSDRGFFPEWQENLPELNEEQVARLNLLKQRYLYHRKHGPLAEGAVNFVVLSPLLELAGFYDPPYLLQSEVSVSLEVAEADELYRGRIDALVLQEQFWVVLLEARRTTFSFDVAIPQALTYMASRRSAERSVFGLVSNGGQFMFLKLAEQGEVWRYELSNEFSLYRQRNELCDVLRVLKRLGMVVGG